MRYSRQRESIFHTVAESQAHPTAGMVYEALRRELPKLSLGTVYRNLSQLTDAGRLKKISLPDGSCRFDGSTHTHSHIVCNKCGRVADVELPAVLDLAEVIRAETAYTLSTYDLVMYGECENCHQSGNPLT